MPRKTILPRTALTALALVVIAPGLPADDNVPKAAPGYKIVMVHAHGQEMPVQVKEASDPFRNVKASAATPGKYDPSRVFSSTSSMADKSFSMGPDAFAGRSFDLKQESTFVSKSYDDTAAWTAPTTGTSYRSTVFSRPATGFDHAFAGTKTEETHGAVLAASADTAADRTRTAALDGPSTPRAYPVDTAWDKQYLGPGAQRVPDGIQIKENRVLSQADGLPNRPLSIDEVRNLINHGTKPNTDQPPDEASKPLDDPGYKPQPLRDDPSPPSDGRPDEDKDDAVPSPGTMAAPETLDPLPQK